MMIELLKSKIHRATVTDANIDYVGSITISEDLCKAAQIVEYQKVSVVNINNGERFETYVLYTEKPGSICLNGAAARKASIGDLIIIMTYEFLDKNEITGHSPKVILLNEMNQIIANK